MRYIVFTCLAVLSNVAVAEVTPSHPPASDFCDRPEESGWFFYCSDEPEPLEEPAPPPAPAPAASPPPPPSYTEQMKAFQENLEELKHKAILVPTPQNIEDYQRAQAQMVTMAGAFAEGWQRNTFAIPDLDSNITHPITGIGTNFRQDQAVLEREAALRDATTALGLMYVYGGQSNCPQCIVMNGIVADLADRYQIAVLPVSKDGAVDPMFPATVFDQGQLSRFDLGDIPLPFLALVDPRADRVDLVGAGILTQDMIMERIRIIYAVPEGDLYD